MQGRYGPDLSKWPADRRADVGAADTPGAVSATRAWIRAHKGYFRRVGVPWATCPCGRRVLLDAAYRCRCCGVWFCSVCSAEHFGLWIDAAGEPYEPSLWDRLRAWIARRGR